MFHYSDFFLKMQGLNYLDPPISFDNVRQHILYQRRLTLSIRDPIRLITKPTCQGGAKNVLVNVPTLRAPPTAVQYEAKSHCARDHRG